MNKLRKINRQVRVGLAYWGWREKLIKYVQYKNQKLNYSELLSIKFELDCLVVTEKKNE